MLMRISAVLALALTLALSALAQEPAGTRNIVRERPGKQKWALLVGVNDYTHVRDLQYCVADVKAFRDQLAGAGFPKDHLYLLSDEEAKADSKPFKGNIETALDVMLGALDAAGKKVTTPGLVEKGDLVVIMFSGHGLHIDGESFLCPADAQIEKRDTLVSLEQIYRRLEGCEADIKLLVVDACRNDPRPDGTKEFKATTETKAFASTLEAPPKGILVLTSCAPGQLSVEDEKFGHGVFMNFILEGLGGKADQEEGNRNERVSLLELYNYAQSRTKTHVATTRRLAQTPRLRGEIEGDWEFGGRAYPKPGSTIENSIGMKLAYIPAGEYMRGNETSPEKLAQKYSNTTRAWFTNAEPAHRVRITKAFYTGQHEVTVGQFRQFARAEGYQSEAERDGIGGYGFDADTGPSEDPNPKYTWNHVGWNQTDRHPVLNVSWRDAQAFCTWLSRKEGKIYRLPTEAEWEYACRAGSKSAYSSGDDAEELVEVGNVADATAKRKFIFLNPTTKADDGYVFTAPVGQFKPNAWGLYDMHGNVSEWCQDWYDEKEYARYSEEIAIDPIGPASGSHRVVRGGSWNGVPGCRSAYRAAYTPPYRGYYSGFRVVLSP